jgi:adenylate cyclase, class 2
MATKLEIEIKLPVRDLPALLRRLRKIGARNRGRVFEENTLYDTPAADFRRYGRLIRLRIETSKSGHRDAKLTSKAPPPHNRARGRAARSAALHKERLENEANVRDPARAARLLRAIGLRPSFRYEKYRTSFRLGALHLDLDETPVGTFLELEGPPAPIDRTAGALGYSTRDYIRGTYWDVYAADCRRRGRKPRNMLFAHKKRSQHSLFA